MLKLDQIILNIQNIQMPIKPILYEKNPNYKSINSSQYIIIIKK